MDEYWQWMTGLVLGLAVLLIPVVGWRLYLRTLPAPDVATGATREPTERYDVQFKADMIVDAREQEEYERLYGRLRNRSDVVLRREQLL